MSAKVAQKVWYALVIFNTTSKLLTKSAYLLPSVTGSFTYQSRSVVLLSINSGLPSGEIAPNFAK